MKKMAVRAVLATTARVSGVGLTMALVASIGCANDLEVDDNGELLETAEVVNPSGEDEQALMPACGTTLQTFDGTAAKSNGRDTGTGTACAGQGGIAGGLQYQCVELVMRHFKRKWDLRWYGNARDLLRGAPRDKVNVFSNGDRDHPPVPGDMVVWEVGQWGHVALVTAVGADFVDVIEQNVSNSNGKARLPFANGRIGARWGSWVPAGWAHAKDNHASGGAPVDGGGDCGNIAKVGAVIDDDHACFDVGGTASYWRAESNQGYGSDLLWTHATAAPDADNSVTWRLNIGRAGKYRVEAFVDGDVATSRQAHYRIRHNGVVDTKDLDQAAAAGWRKLGDFQFARGDEQRVWLGDNSGERGSLDRKIVFDAVRVTPVCDSLEVATDAGVPVNVRADHDSATRKLGELSSGAVVQRLDTRNGEKISFTSAWHQVRKGSLTGWVSGAYLACAP